MKKKKILITALALLASATAVVSCSRNKPDDTSNNGTNQGSTIHTHTYSAEWSYDDANHWHSSTCGHDDKSQFAPHTIVDGKCTICGYKTPTEGLNYTLSEDGSSYILSGVKDGLTLSGELVIANTYEGKRVIGVKETAFIGNTDITSITIPNNIETIEYGAFAKCSGLTSLVIPGNVKTIEKQAFAYCDKLTTLTLEEGVTNLGEAAFEECAELGSVTLPNSVTLVSESLFSNCKKLSNVTLGNSVTGVLNGAFYGCSGLVSITLPETISLIDEYAFDGCSSLSSINIPNNLKTLGYRAFDYCTSLNGTVYDNACYIGNDTNPYLILLKGKAEDITSVKINEQCKFIHSEAFRSSTNLTNVTIPNSVESIGYFAFDYCNGLTYNEYDNACYLGNDTNPYLVLMKTKSQDITSCIINENCKIIYNNAFESCKSLTSITIPNKVVSIGQKVFRGCISLTNIVIPNSVDNIGEEAFKACKKLKNIVFSTSVTSIGKYLIEGCYNFESVYYMGTIEEWNNVELYGDSNSALLSKPIYYYSETKPTDTTNKYWHYVDGVVTEW